MKDPNKKYDLSKWKYAELRDTINTSCGMYIVDSLNITLLGIFTRDISFLSGWL